MPQSSGKGSGGLPTRKGNEQRPSQRVGSGWEALQEGQEWLVGHPGGVRGPPGGPEGVRRPTRCTSRGW